MWADNCSVFIWPLVLACINGVFDMVKLNHKICHLRGQILWNQCGLTGQFFCWCKLYEVSTRTWAVSLDTRPNRTWGCAHILFFNSAQVCCVHLIASVQRNYMRERFCSTLLRLLTAIGLYLLTCKNITRTKSHIYLELSAKRASIRTYINMHAQKKLTYFFICLLKIRHARAKKT